MSLADWSGNSITKDFSGSFVFLLIFPSNGRLFEAWENCFLNPYNLVAKEFTAIQHIDKSISAR